MVWPRSVAVLLASSALASCTTADPDSEPSYDLPVGWEQAEPIAAFMQADCSGNPYDGTHDERIEVGASPGTVEIDYLDAEFSCAQEVEGFVKLDSGSVEVLVQPVEMDPTELAGCDCLYTINMAIPGVEAGEVEVSLVRRWTNWQDPNDPVAIGAQTVTVP